ncbi:MAG: ligase-associated DNA damage response endonuclease PdeM [Deinococcota bacterium]
MTSTLKPHWQPLNITWQQHDFVLINHALFWPSENVLLISDLHLGRAETFQRAGLPLPSGHEEADLARLASLQAFTGATKVYILGDVIHARSGMTEVRVEAFAEWLEQLPASVQLIAGNHDRSSEQIFTAWGLEASASILLAGIHLVHEPQTEGMHICGHIHPVAQVGSRRDYVRLPCFVVAPKRIILPAFTQFSGGHLTTRAAKCQRFVVADNQVIALPY